MKDISEVVSVINNSDQFLADELAAQYAIDKKKSYNAPEIAEVFVMQLQDLIIHGANFDAVYALSMANILSNNFKKDIDLTLH